MESELTQAIQQKLADLLPEQQAEVLRFIESLEQKKPRGRLKIWDEIDAITREVPLEEWQQLPSDGSINVDHYLYGAPKKQ